MSRVTLGKALSLSGPRPPDWQLVHGRGSVKMFQWLWRGAGVALPRVLLVPASHLAPLLITRETNLKFRQAPVVTHHELTSIRDMTSFQGEW